MVPRVKKLKTKPKKGFCAARQSSGPAQSQIRLKNTQPANKDWPLVSAPQPNLAHCPLLFYRPGTTLVQVISAAINELDDARESYFYKVALGRLEAILAVFCRVNSWRVLEIRNNG